MTAPAKTELESKLARLREIMSEIGGAVAAFSGGVDSSLLVAVGHEVMGGRMLAVTAVSPGTPADEVASARELARLRGFRHAEIETGEFEDAEFLANTPERCYHCKRVRYGALAELARREGLPFVMDGSNVDDANEFRPGERAASELGVRHPLREADLTKSEVRSLSRELGLPGWERPPAACLVSRVPYGEELNAGMLRRIDEAESFLRGLVGSTKSSRPPGLGYDLVRVRVHSAGAGAKIARIEVAAERVAEFARTRASEAARRLRELGFAYVALDLEGYRTGSMDESLTAGEGDR